MSSEIRGIEGLDDQARMDELINYIKVQVGDETDHLANASNIAAFIYGCMRDVNWAGFYFYNSESNDLVLGPFQGQPACTRLSIDKGVCAKAFVDEKITKVDDVHLFPGHIACDSRSESELVIPLLYDGKAYGVLDIDSPIKNRFSDIELEGFSKIASLIEGKIYMNFN